jgi:hypothetical protein
MRLDFSKPKALSPSGWYDIGQPWMTDLLFTLSAQGFPRADYQFRPEGGITDRGLQTLSWRVHASHWLRACAFPKAEFRTLARL